MINRFLAFVLPIETCITIGDNAPRPSRPLAQERTRRRRCGEYGPGFEADHFSTRDNGVPPASNTHARAGRLCILRCPSSGRTRPTAKGHFFKGLGTEQYIATREKDPCSSPSHSELRSEKVCLHFFQRIQPSKKGQTPAPVVS
jgi:hypothetical protein